MNIFAHNSIQIWYKDATRAQTTQQLSPYDYDVVKRLLLLFVTLKISETTRHGLETGHWLGTLAKASLGVNFNLTPTPTHFHVIGVRLTNWLLTAATPLCL